MHDGPGLQRLRELIGEVRIALLTTLDGEGQMHTRPIETLQCEPDGTLWFFTACDSPKSAELRHDTRVSLGYSHPGKSIYVAVSGVGSVGRDIAKAAELWSPGQLAFYPQGLEDPRLALLKVRLERAEYWVTPGKASYVLAAVNAALTGTPAGVLGENRKLP